MNGLGSVLRLLWRAHRGQAIALAVLTIATGLLPTVTVLATGRLVAALVGSSNHLWLVAAFVGALYVTEQALAPVTAALAWSLGSRYTLLLRETVAAATLGPSGIAHLEDPAVVDEIAAVEGSEARPWLRQMTAPALMGVVSTWLQGIGAAVVLLRFHWWAPVVLAVAWAGTHRWVAREVATFTRSLDSSTADLRRSAYYRDLALRPAAAKELRVFGLGSWAVGRYERLWRQGMGAIWRERRGHVGLMAQAIVLVAAGNAIVLGALGREALTGGLGVAALVVYAQAALGTMALGAQGDQQRLLSEGATLARRATRLAGRIAAATPPVTVVPGPRIRAERGIRFENVSFTYPGSERPVLDGLDLFIPAGRSLAIVGENGAGKTTLIKLLTRLYEPTGGRILVDGVDLRALTPDEWCRRVGVVFQDFVRLDLPARDNVGIGSPLLARDDAMLDAVARDVGADGIVARLPRGWDTVLSRAYEGGADLSGGEWQRIALARTLLSVRGGASTLVLDEPTANLDVRAEADLFDRVLALAGGTTTILVSHRLSSVRRVDHICLVGDGRVAEQGSHDELVALGGTYAHLYALQASRFGEPAVADA